MVFEGVFVTFINELRQYEESVFGKSYSQVNMDFVDQYIKKLLKK